MNHLRRAASAAPLLLLLLAGGLAGCTAAPAPPHVAQLPSGAAASASVAAPATGSTSSDGTGSGSGAATAASTAGRPQLQIGDSDARVAALGNAYRACLLQHGARRAGAGEMGATVSRDQVGILVHQPVPQTALAACLHLDPLPPRALNAATNPRFHEQSLQWIACLQRKGLWFTLTDDRDLTATYTPGHAVPDGLDEQAAEDSCTAAVFGGR